MRPLSSVPSGDSSPEGAGSPGLAELLRRVARGDEAAFASLYDATAARVHGLVLRVVRDPAQAEEVTQETFLQVYRHLPSFRGESQFRTWLYRIASNAALMHRRARARRPAESLDVFLPRFDADGRHVATPTELQVASRPDELLDRKFLVNASDSLKATRELTEREGIFAGISSGAVLHVARRIASELDRGDVVCLLADGGWKYLSTDAWDEDVTAAEKGVEESLWW